MNIRKVMLSIAIHRMNQQPDTPEDLTTKHFMIGLHQDRIKSGSAVTRLQINDSEWYGPKE
jgi:hypothetical protein